MVKNHYRWDFIGLSTDTKPTPDTSEKVADGSTFYESDTSKYYVWCQDDWYEKTATGGGGGGAVNTVNNVSPDSSGNVELTPSDIGAQAALTAGSNITIDDGTISATDTIYSNFVGTDGQTAGTAGLVPAPATTDAGKFLKADGTWDTAGSSVNVVQTTGTSTTDVMSQKAVSQMIFPSGYETSKTKIAIGDNASSNAARTIMIGSASTNSYGAYSICIGTDLSIPSTSRSNSGIVIGSHAIVDQGSNDAIAIGTYSGVSSNKISSIAIGCQASAGGAHSVAIGDYAKTSAQGEFNIGVGVQSYGYNSSNYRLLTGLYDPQSDHDAATKGYVDNAVINGGTTQPTTSTVGAVGTQYNCVNSGTPEIYICTDVTGGTYTWTKIN